MGIKKENKKNKEKESWIKPEFKVLSLENTEAKTFNGTEQFLNEITNREPS